MLKKIFILMAICLIPAGIAFAKSPAAKTSKNPVVIMETSMGNIKIELFQKEAPLSVKNFLSYVQSGFYDGTIFHRVIPGFMIQGGGFTADLKQKPTGPSIRNEADNGLKTSGEQSPWPAPLSRIVLLHSFSSTW